MTSLKVTLKRPASASLPLSPQLQAASSKWPRKRFVSTDSDIELLSQAGADLIEEEEIPLVSCEWSGCNAQFWILEKLIDHLHQVHVDSAPKNKYTCEWIDCKHRGKLQTSKNAIVTHLRVHTGEKPFICYRPECDKSFTRADALQKHMKTTHSEILPPTRKPARKRKAGELESIDGDDLLRDDDLDSGSLMGDTLDGQSDAGAINTVVTQESFEEDADHVKLAISQHPDQDPDLVRYVILLAQQSYLANERDALNAEMDVLQRKQDQLVSQKDQLLQQVLDKELGEEAWQLVGPLPANAIQPLQWSFTKRTSLAQPSRSRPLQL